MTDKQQIEELTKNLSILQNCGMVIIESQMDWRGSTHKEIKNKAVAEALYNVNYRRVADDEIVIKKSDRVNVFAEDFEELIRKETAKEVLQELKNRIVKAVDQYYMTPYDGYYLAKDVIDDIIDVAHQIGVEVE